ncbi:MAG: MarR family transcriptional regulator [Candidatus Omnitrophica bacterium]|nr:MarR family transcriptional regulator [Candidatus Omnitrophota bacterium]
MPKTKTIDQRDDYYFNRVKEHGASYPQFHWPSLEIYLNLIYTFDIITSHMATQTDPYGITRAGFGVLMILSRSPHKSCKQNEISQLLLVSRANITGLVDSLVRQELVERTSDPNDRRVNQVKILPKGEKLLEGLLPDYYKHVQNIFSVFTVNEKKTFNDLLTRLRNRTNEIKNS